MSNLQANLRAAAAQIAQQTGRSAEFAARADNAIRAEALAYQNQGGGSFYMDNASPKKGAVPLTVHQPGGDIVNLLRHPSFLPVEHLFRVQPQPVWFTAVTPSNPHRFPLGAFRVSKGRRLFLLDYEFSIYRFSGVDAGDTLPAEEGRFSGVMGFDINISGSRQGDLNFEITPQPIAVTPPEYRQKPNVDPRTGALIRATNDDFNAAAARGFAVSSGVGASLLPVRREVYGARRVPFTIHVKASTTVSLTGVVFKRLQSPVAFVQARVAGFMLAEQQAEVLINRLRPR